MVRVFFFALIQFIGVPCILFFQVSELEETLKARSFSEKGFTACFKQNKSSALSSSSNASSSKTIASVASATPSANPTASTSSITDVDSSMDDNVVAALFGPFSNTSVIGNRSFSSRQRSLMLILDVRTRWSSTHQMMRMSLFLVFLIYLDTIIFRSSFRLRWRDWRLCWT